MDITRLVLSENSGVCLDLPDLSSIRMREDRETSRSVPINVYCDVRFPHGNGAHLRGIALLMGNTLLIHITGAQTFQGPHASEGLLILGYLDSFFAEEHTCVVMARVGRGRYAHRANITRDRCELMTGNSWEEV